MMQAPPQSEEATLAEVDLDDWEAWQASAAADAGMSATAPSVPTRVKVAVGIILAAVLGFAWFAFEGPVQDEWYRSRQERLAGEFAQPHPGVPVGGPAAVLQAKSLGLSVYVVQGDAPTQLRGGPGHRVGTPLPGHRGNSVIMGHRDQWGGPFARLAQVPKLLKAQPNTYFVTQLRKNEPPIVAFRVVKVARVDANDVHLFAPSTDTRLTLVTDAGRGKRLVVVAISGTPGKLLDKRSGRARATTPGGSLLFDVPTVLAFLAFGFALVAMRLMSGRFRGLAIGVVVIPLVAAGLFGLLLQVDRVLPPLR
jgi:hypothetical protein